MSKKDEIKEDIATYRAYSLLFITSLFGITGYAFVNIDRLSATQTIIGSLACIALVISIVIVIKQYLKAKKELRNIK